HRRAFDTVFNVYFSLYSLGIDPDADELGGLEGLELDGGVQQGNAPGGAGTPLSREEIAEMLLRALMSMDREAMRRLAAIAVQQFAGMEPGRPVGGTYYLYRTLRALDLDALTERMMGMTRDQGEASEGELADRLLREEFEARLKELRELVEEEIRRALV